MLKNLIFLNNRKWWGIWKHRCT